MADHIAAYGSYLEQEKHASANTVSSYLRDLNQFRSWLLENGAADLRRVKTDTINEYLRYLERRGKSPATVTRSAASLKSFYGYMQAAGVMKANPAKAVVTHRAERKYPEILTNKEVELFLEQPRCVDEKGFRDHAMLELLYATGIRVSELIGLNVTDVNLTAGFIRCSSRGKERIIPLYHGAVKALQDYIRDIRPRIIANETETALFVNMNGERMSRQGFFASRLMVVNTNSPTSPSGTGCKVTGSTISTITLSSQICKPFCSVHSNATPGPFISDIPKQL